MKKRLCAVLVTLLALMMFATSAFAAEMRWRNVMLHRFLPAFPQAMADTLVKSMVYLVPRKSIARSSSTRRAGLALIRRSLAHPRLIMAKYMNFPAAPPLNLAPPISW